MFEEVRCVPSETSTPQAEIRTIIIRRQHLRVAIRKGDGTRTQPELAREFARTARLGSALGYFYQMLGAVGWTSIRWLRKLRQPTLIMHGDDDPLVPQVNAKIMHRLIPRAKLYIFHDGHLGLGTSAGRRAVSHSSRLFLNRQRLIRMI